MAGGRSPYLMRTPDGACLDDRVAVALAARSAMLEVLIGCAVATAGTTMVVVRRVHAGGIVRRAGVVEGSGTPDELARLAGALAAQALVDGPAPLAAQAPQA